MKYASILFFLLLLSYQGSWAQNLYSKAYGDKKAEPVVFLHGGPGYNSANFEATSAQALADKGYYVVVYDRRGEGRSPDKEAEFTFEETFKDLKSICKKYKLKKPTLLGHSFGGMVGTRFAETFPKKVKALVLIGAPVSLQASFSHIITQSKAIYEKKRDAMNLDYIRMLENMDTKSIQYSSYCFMHAMKNGFYTPSNPTERSQEIYAQLQNDAEMVKWTKKMDFFAVQGFWENEHYTTLNLTDNLKAVVANGTPVYGLYGKDDGLYPPEEIESIANIIGKEKLKIVDNCSHNVFIDQQENFIATLSDWLF